MVGTSAIPFNLMERFNRQSILLTSYRLSLNKEKQKNKNISKERKEELAIEAIMDTQRLNGGTVLESGSRLAQQSVGRVALMYKSYGVRMYVTMLKSSVLALMNAKNISQQEKRVYIKEIIGVHLSALALSGVYGTPIYGLVKILLNLFYDDDELDADSRVREYLGEGWFKGGPTAALNLDISSRIRLNSLIIQENRFAGSMSVEEQLFFHFGGPGFSTVKSILRGTRFY